MNKVHIILIILVVILSAMLVLQACSGGYDENIDRDGQELISDKEYLGDVDGTEIYTFNYGNLTCMLAEGLNSGGLWCR